MNFWLTFIQTLPQNSSYPFHQNPKLRTETIQGSIQQALRTILKTPDDVEKAKVALDEIEQSFKAHH